MQNGEQLTVEVLLREQGHEMDLTLVGGARGLSKRISSPELNRPGLAFAGFYDVFSHDRIQILGNTEISYLNSLTLEDRLQRLADTFRFEIPCVIVTSGHAIAPEILQITNDNGIPLLRSSFATTRLVSLLNTFLEKAFAPVITLHGVLVDVYGMGTLILGRSGVGKSECALELVERGHRLVADDIVVLRRWSKDDLVGRSSEVLKYHMEIRGIGILNIETLFGIASIVEEKRIDLVARLERWDENVEYERLGIEDKRVSILDVRIPEYVIPVQPGRNISLLVEMASLTQRLKNTGVNPAQAMEDKLTAMMHAESRKMRADLTSLLRPEA